MMPTQQPMPGMMMGGPQMPPDGPVLDPAQMQQMAMNLQDPLALALQSRGAAPGPLSPIAQILLNQATDQGQQVMQPDMLNQLMQMLLGADANLQGGGGQAPQMMPNPATGGGMPMAPAGGGYGGGY